MRLDDASPLPLWLDRPRPAEEPPLEGEVDADLAIVGAGLTGLWAAVQAKQDRPLPFPPEPARWAVIQATRRALASADQYGGRRGPWLRLLDRVGLGFDS